MVMSTTPRGWWSGCCSPWPTPSGRSSSWPRRTWAPRPAASSETGPGQVDITASVTVQDAGSVSGDVTLLMAGQAGPDGRKISYCATAVKQTFELLDSASVKVTDMDFSSLFFGAASSKTVTVFNNGPIAAKYTLSYGTTGEMIARAADDSGQGAAEDPDDPYADIISATHQKIRSKATNDNPFTISPLGATIPSYGKATIQINFKPQAIFRGFLLTSLWRYMSPQWAVAASSLLFAMCHFRLQTFLPLLVLGVVFSFVFLLTLNLLPPMVLHSVWNVFVLANLLLRPG